MGETEWRELAAIIADLRFLVARVNMPQVAREAVARNAQRLEAVMKTREVIIPTGAK